MGDTEQKKQDGRCDCEAETSGGRQVHPARQTSQPAPPPHHSSSPKTEATELATGASEVSQVAGDTTIRLDGGIFEGLITLVLV